MEILSLGVLALVLGLIYTYVQPKLAAAVPASFPQNKFAQAFLTGAFIMVAFLAANLVLSIVPGLKGRK